MSDRTPPEGTPGEPDPDPASQPAPEGEDGGPPPQGPSPGGAEGTASKGGGIVGRLLGIVGVVAVVIVGRMIFSSVFGGPELNDLSEGDCVTAEGLTESTSEEVSDLEVVDCTEPHDGEVLGAKQLSAQEAEDFDPAGSTMAHCAEYASQVPEGITGTTLTESATPDEGDQVICMAFSADGERLTEKIG